MMAEYNDKAHVTMEPMTREMQIPKGTKMIGIVGDNESERVDIDIPRWYDGIDLGSKSIYIVVSNDNEQSDTIIPEIKKDGEQLHLTWIVKSKHVSSEGTVYAHILATDTSGFKWQSLDGEYEVKTVNDGPESMPDTQITAVEQKLIEMDSAKLQAANAAAAAIAAATETAPPIISTAEGVASVAADSADRPLRGLTVFGRTTQDGTPTEDTPVVLESVGQDGNVDVYVNGANLFDASADPITTVATTVERIGDGIRVTSTHPTQNYEYAGWVGVHDLAGMAGMDFTFAANAVPSGDHTGRVRIGVIDENGNAVGSKKYDTGAGKLSVTFSLDETNAIPGNRLTVELYAIATGTPGKGIYTDYSDIQLSIGDSVTSYAPYTGQTATISTAEGLRGVSAMSGAGTYMDADGQGWIADTVEYDAQTGTAQIVRRVASVTYDGSADEDWGVTYGYNALCVSVANAARISHGLCTHFEGMHIANDQNAIGFSAAISDGLIAFRPNDYAHLMLDIDAWRAQLNASPVTVLYALAVPEMTPITGDELAALTALRSRYPATTAFNDAGAQMAVRYVADTKNYVDQRIEQLTNAVVSTGANI